MSKIKLHQGGEPATPATGTALIYIDSADGLAKQKDDAGLVTILANVPAVAPTHASTTGQTADDHHAKLHSATHGPGGGDALKLDDLEVPDDNTDLDVSITKHGLTPKLPNDATKYLNGVGGYTVPSSVVPMILSFANDQKIPLKAKDDTYMTEAIIGYPGSTLMGVPTTIKIETTDKDGSITYDVKVFNLTSGLTIVEKTGISPAVPLVYETIDLGTLANIPTSYSVWEVQIKLSAAGAGKEAYVASLSMY